MGCGTSSSADALCSPTELDLTPGRKGHTPCVATLSDAWTQEYAVYGSFTSRDLGATSKLVLADAEIQVKDEPRAPRFAVLGVPTPGRYQEELEPTENKLFWLASFETKDAYDVDHKSRESNKVFVQELMLTGLDPENPMTNFAGSFMGSAWHLEVCASLRAMRAMLAVRATRARAPTHSRTNTHQHAPTPINTHQHPASTHQHPSTHQCAPTCTNTCSRTHACMHKRTHAYLFVCICLRASAHMCGCMCLRMHMHAHKLTQVQAHTQMRVHARAHPSTYKRLRMHTRAYSRACIWYGACACIWYVFPHPCRPARAHENRAT